MSVTPDGRCRKARFHVAHIAACGVLEHLAPRNQQGRIAGAWLAFDEDLSLRLFSFLGRRWA